MSKTGRGILRDPGPYFRLYSPECVEEVFCELRRDGLPPKFSEREGMQRPEPETSEGVQPTVE